MGWRIKNKSLLRIGGGIVCILVGSAITWFWSAVTPGLQVQGDQSFHPLSLPFNGLYKKGVNGQIGFPNSHIRSLNYKECNTSSAGMFCYGNLELGTESPFFKKYNSLFKDRNFALIKPELDLGDDPSHFILNQQGAQFDVLQGGTYKNSGDQIIFDRPKDQSLIIYMKSDVQISGRYQNIYSGHLLRILPENLKTLPTFHSLSAQRSYGGKQMEDRYPINYDVRNSPTGPKASASLIAKVPTTVKFVFQGYQRESKKPEFALIDAANVPVSNDKISATISGTSLLVDLQGLQPDTSYQLTLKVDDVPYQISFSTFGAFKLVSQKNIAQRPEQISVYREGERVTQTQMVDVNNYHLCFNQPLNETGLRQDLTKQLGTGGFSLAFTYDDGTDSYLKERNYCAMFYYYVDPTKSITFVLPKIQSIFGETTTAQVTIPTHNIPEEQKFATVAGNRFNVLPKNGFLGDKVQIAYKNIKQATLQYAACEMVTGMDYLLANVKKADSDESDHELLFDMVRCEKPQSYTIVFDKFARRANKVVDLPLSKLFGTGVPNLFWIGFGESFNEHQGKIFQRTNIGLFTKYSTNSLHVWPFDLQSGKPLKDVQVEGVIGNTQTTQSTRRNFSGVVNSYGKFPTTIGDSWTQFAGIMTARVGDDTSLVVIGNQYHSFVQKQGISYVGYQNAFAVNLRDVGLNYYGSDETNSFKVYGYTDRALYKPGDTVHVAGWVRKQGSADRPKKDLIITLNDEQGQEIGTTTIRTYDELGGFATNFEIPKSVGLGMMTVSYSYQDIPQGYFVSYLRVEEYKKSTFSLMTEHLTTASGLQFLRVYPRYYFGADLQSFDATLDYSLVGSTQGEYDRTACGQQRCDKPVYYNKIRGPNVQSGGALRLTNFDAKYFDIPLTSLPASYISNFSVDMVITDNQTQEVVSKSTSETVYPGYLVGIEGYDYDWMDLSKKSIQLKGNTLKRTSVNKAGLDNYKANTDGGNVAVDIYYTDFSAKQEQGPDEERYYADQQYKKIGQKTVGIASNGTYELNYPISAAGSYFFRVHYQGGETQQQVYVYDANPFASDRYFGDLGNNNKLTVKIPNKNYQDGDMAQVNIDPYIKGANILLTVEKDGKIIQQQQKVLDGNPLSIKVSKSWYPNAHIGVMQMVGENVNKAISANRKEPRFYVGYGMLQIAPAAMKLSYNISVRNTGGNAQMIYAPGQTVFVTIKTHDANGKPVRARLSVGVVDKALSDLYDQIKTPLETFYSYSSPGFGIVTNLKLLYKALRVVSSDGTKGGGGGGDDGGAPISLANPRKKYLDVAFRTGGVMTNAQGEIKLQVTLPDNLTTRMVEVIGLAKDGQMGSQRDYLTVGQDVVIQPNLPRFVTLGDSIQIPIGVIVNNGSGSAIKPMGRVTLSGQKTPLSIKQINGKWSAQLDMNALDQSQLLAQDVLQVTIGATGADATQQDIPIRKEGLYASTFRTFYQKALNEKIALTGGAKQLRAVLTVSTLPLNLVQSAVEYLIYYPYGCAEQRISGLYPILVAKDLADKGLFESSMIKGDQIGFTTYDAVSGQPLQQRFTIKQLAADTLQKVYLMQLPSGFFGYRGYRNEQPNVELSIYVYQVMALLKQKGYAVNAQRFASLEQSLNTINNPTQILYYELSKALSSQHVRIDKVKEILASDPKNFIHKVMAYLIFATQGIDDTQLQQDISLYFKENFTIALGYQSYYNKNILKSWFVRALVHLGKIQDAVPYVLEFYQSAGPNGQRGRSTQENLQIALALADFIKAQNNAPSVSYSLQANGQKRQGTLDQKHLIQRYELSAQDISAVPITLTANNNVLLDINLDAIPKDRSQLQSHLENMSELTFDLKDTNVARAEIGERLTTVGTFRVTKEANQVAVVYSIPSTVTLVNPTLGQEATQQESYNSYGGGPYGYVQPPQGEDQGIHFENLGNVSTWYSCQPNHIELRFDRLFMVYDHLPAGAACKFTFDVLKTHNGQATMLPSRLFEMYTTNVRGIQY